MACFARVARGLRSTGTGRDAVAHTRKNFAESTGSKGDARMLRFWRDGILKSQRGFIGAWAETASRASTGTSELLADALEHESIGAEMWIRVGTLLVRQGETTRGAAAFRIALRLESNNSEAHRQLATLLAAHGSSAEAAAHYERFLDLTDTSRQETRARPTETLVVERGEELQRSERGSSSWTLLGRMLVDDGVITETQLSEALERQRTRKDRIGQILIEMQVLDEEVLLTYLGRQYRKEPITHEQLEALDLEIVKLIPEVVARQHRIIAAERHGRKLIVATADPLNVVALDDLSRATR